MDILPTDTLVKLCIGAFTDEEIKMSKDLLFEMCSDSPRNVKHQGENMNENHIKDVLKLLQQKKGDVPATFVVKDLTRLPPVTFDSVNVCVLLTKLEKALAEVELLKSGMDSQVKTTESLVETTSTLCRDVADTRRSRHTPQGEPSFPNDGIAMEPLNDTDATSVKQLVPSKPSTPYSTALKGAAGGTVIDDPRSGDGFTTVVKRQKRSAQTRKPQGITGKAKSDTLKTIAKPRRMANVFASRFDPDVTDDEVKNYLKEKLQLEMTVEKVKTRFNTYSSFHIICYCENPEVFMQEEIWPERTYVRWWRNDKGAKDGGRSNRVNINGSTDV